MKVLGNPTAPVKATAPQQPAGIKRVALADESSAVQPTPEAERIKDKAMAKQEAVEESGGQPVAVEESGGEPITGESGGEPTPAEDAGDAVVFLPPLPTAEDPIPGIEDHEEPDEELSRICGPHAAAVNNYLRDKNQVGPHQSFLSVSKVYRGKVLANPSGFLDRVRAYAGEGRAA